MFESTIVRARMSAAGAKRGQKNQVLGRSGGGFGTKSHLKTDHRGQPIAFCLTGGERNDAPLFETLLDLDPNAIPRTVVADKGYDSNANREAARKQGVWTLIPFQSCHKDIPKTFGKKLCRGQARMEQAIGKLRRFKHIALRCEKTKQNFPSFVAIAAALTLVKSVHTA